MLAFQNVKENDAVISASDTAFDYLKNKITTSTKLWRDFCSLSIVILWKTPAQNAPIFLEHAKSML